MVGILLLLAELDGSLSLVHQNSKVESEEVEGGKIETHSQEVTGEEEQFEGLVREQGLGLGTEEERGAVHVDYQQKQDGVEQKLEEELVIVEANAAGYEVAVVVHFEDATAALPAMVSPGGLEDETALAEADFFVLHELLDVFIDEEVADGVFGKKVFETSPGVLKVVLIDELQVVSVEVLVGELVPPLGHLPGVGEHGPETSQEGETDEDVEAEDFGIEGRLEVFVRQNHFTRVQELQVEGPVVAEDQQSHESQNEQGKIGY